MAEKLLPTEVAAFYARKLGQPAFIASESDGAGGQLDLHGFPPTRGRPFWVVGSLGMSGRAMNVPPQAWRAGTPLHAEMLLLLPKRFFGRHRQGASAAALDRPEAWPVRFTRMLARMPRLLDGWLAVGHVIPGADAPHADGYSGAVLLPPIGAFDPEDHVVQTASGRGVQLLSPTFLYLDEMEYQTRHGYQALASLLHDRGVTSLFQPQRRSVVANPWWRFW